MVHHTYQHVFALGDAEKPCPQRDLGREVKTVAGGFLDGLIQLGRRPCGRIDDVPAEVGPLGRHHQLLRYPVGRGDQCAQAFVAGHHIGQRRTQRVGVKAPAQSQRHRHVVNR